VNTWPVTRYPNTPGSYVARRKPSGKRNGDRLNVMAVGICTCAANVNGSRTKKEGDNVKEYGLIVNQHHMTELLEALRGHYVAAENAPGTSEQVKGICADLLRRAELLDAVITAGDDLREAQEAYDHYIQYGDAPSTAPVKVLSRPI